MFKAVLLSIASIKKIWSLKWDRKQAAVGAHRDVTNIKSDM